MFAASLYAYRFDLTAWGWIHISLITQFMFVPYYPLWAIPVMTLDLLVIFALTRFHAGTNGGR
ncbi:DUF7144 family membrane protein [Streptomyces chartreusis]